MTRDEVIKALECCIISEEERFCPYDCPYQGGEYTTCEGNLMCAALALLKAEPKRGRWIPEPDRERHWHCSVCGYTAGIAAQTYNYCPCCGAEMESEP